MTTKNIQDAVESAVEKRVGIIITACFYNDGTKKSVTDVIDVEIPALVADLTQLVKEVEAGEQKRIYDSFADCPSFDVALNERDILTPPTSDEDKVHGVIIGKE